MVKLLILIFIMLLSSIIGAICWPYTINFWLTYTHHPAIFTWWQGALISLLPFIGNFSIAVAVITFIISFFIN